MSKDYWNWERAYGSTSVNVKEAYGEFFNTPEFKSVDTLVRETVQNILDAKNPKNKDPVEVEFGFGESDDPFMLELFESLKRHRSECPNILDEDFKKVKWLYIKDRNTTGLLGDTKKRSNSNFWKYWMKFGSGTKEKGQLGRHGVGRISIMLGSKSHTLLGATLRHGEKDLIMSGISLLDNVESGGYEKTSTALLVKDFNKNKDVFNLHDDTDTKKILAAFNVELKEPGFLILVINPKDEISTKRIKAAVIEHFGSAILNNQLKVKCEGSVINADNIKSIASEVYYLFQIANMKHDYTNYLEIVSKLHSPEPKERISLDKPRRLKLWNPGEEKLKEYRRKLIHGELLLFEIFVPLSLKTEEGTQSADVSFKVGFKKPCSSQQGIETYHRRGMSIPRGGQTLVLNGNISSVMTAAGHQLADLLNICEGKAHLSWSKTDDILQELNKRCESGEEIRDMCANSLRDLYQLINESDSEPDSSVWEKFFNIPSQPAQETGVEEEDIVEEEEEDTREKETSSYNQIETKTGFMVKANPEFVFKGESFIRLRVNVAYETEGKDPWKWWKPVDFDFLQIQQRTKMIEHSNCDISWLTGNSFEITAMRNDFKVEANCFDTNRELAIKIHRLD